MGADTIRRENPKVVQYVDRRLFTAFTLELVTVLELMPAPWKRHKRGRPGHAPKIVAAMDIIYIAFGHTYNSVESEVSRNERVARIFGVQKLPGHSVIHRGIQKLPMWWVRKVIAAIVAKIYRKGIIVYDSTGKSLLQRSTWYRLTIKNPICRRDFLKLHIIVCYNTGLILDFRITKGYAHDSPIFRAMAKKLQFSLMIGDSAVASKEGFEMINRKGALAIIQPRKDAIARARGSKAWKEAVRWSKTEVFKLLKGFRSIVEGTISSLKRIFGDSVRAKKKRIQKKEQALQILAYNIRRALHIKTAIEMNEPLWIYPQ